MELVFIFLSVAVAGIAGFMSGRKLSVGTQEKARLELELKEKQDELDAFRNKVNSHFEKTADLFNEVSDSYQSLYDHMAKSSNQLCATPSFQSLPSSSETKLEAKSKVKRKTNNDEKNMFDANRLYNAHAYRDQKELETKKLAEKENTAKIVDIESAKDEPALDYAIKAKGVINHDSLKTENTKKSNS